MILFKDKQTEKFQNMCVCAVAFQRFQELSFFEMTLTNI